MDESHLEAALQQEVLASERTRDLPYPAQTRGRRATRGVVLSVRLSESEYARLIEAADRRELPPSTLVRSLVQEFLGGHNSGAVIRVDPASSALGRSVREMQA
jgi:predicted DNA-binding ribbon-helix-helix protein